MKKIAIATVAATIIAAGSILGYRSYQESKHVGLTLLMLENIEALTQGEVQVVGCCPYKGATCYVFDGNGQLVDKRKNQAPCK